MKQGPILLLDEVEKWPVDSCEIPNAEAHRAAQIALYTTFDPASGLHCEHCPELAEHTLESDATGRINLCAKCLHDALDVIRSLENFGREPKP